jgi:hypothetical protein
MRTVPAKLATILEMHDDAATLECWCDGQKTVVGKLAYRAIGAIAW